MRFLGFFADVLSEPDAEWGPTWEVKCACVFVRLWVHSPAALFCTDHINDTTEAWAVDCSLKAERRTKCEMEEEAGWRGVWGGRKREPELKSSETKQVTVREKGEKKKKKKKKQRGTEQQHDSAPAGQHSSFLSPPLLELSSSFLPSFALPSWSLSDSLWDQDLFLPPHIITAALAGSLLMLLLIYTSSRLVTSPPQTSTSAVLLSWSDLAFYLTPGRSSVHSLSGDGRRRGGSGGQRTGEGSIWLVNFNAGADVPLCVLVRSVGWKKHHAMIIWGNICSLHRLEAAALILHIWPAVLAERDLSLSVLLPLWS